MKVGDLVKSINWQQLGPAPLVGGPPRPASEKEYPAEPMRGIIIEKVKVVRSAGAGDPWDFMVLWESGRVSQLSKNGIEKIRHSHEDRVRSACEEVGVSEEQLDRMLQSAREADEWARQKYGCQCRGCDDHRDRFPLRYEKNQSGLHTPRPGCIHSGEANESR